VNVIAGGCVDQRRSLAAASQQKKNTTQHNTTQHNTKTQASKDN
jgi:hypothetical protein